MKKLICLFWVLAICALPVAAQYDDISVDVPYVPSPPEVVQALHKLAGTGPGDIAYDLGCGDGRLVVAAVKDFKARRAVGVDINPERIREAEENAKQNGVADRTKFIQKSFYDADVSEASVVTLYLLSGVNLKMRPKLIKELKAGSRIVSHTFDMGEWKPPIEETVNGRKVYLWIVTDEVKKRNFTQ